MTSKASDKTRPKRPKQAPRKAKHEPLFGGYQPLEGTYDELLKAGGRARAGFASLVKMLDQLGATELKTRQRLASSTLFHRGTTFSVYSDTRGVERIFPFDVIPRVLTAAEWDKLEAGLTQRLMALNRFLGDVYGKQRILKDEVVPRELVERSAGYLRQVQGIRPRGGVYVHVAGIDLIRDGAGEFRVLEDNLRTPSGVSYVLENRTVMKRVLPHVLAEIPLRRVDDYPTRLRQALGSLSPRPARQSRVVVLTPGPLNSAYFEHSFLARGMGTDLVHPSDLFVHDQKVFVKTTAGPQRVDVIYRRIDDDFLDPKVFRPDSLLGVPGIFEAYAKGNVTLANALGNGVADDKALYPFVPAMIRYYLSEEPLLKQIDTLVCARPKDCARVLAELSQMVVKEVDGSGGYGMLLGPQASKKELHAYAERVRADPRKFIAQPLIQLSTCPTWIGSGVEPRRVDLRPFLVTGKSTWVLPGGLTRVALPAGSYVVNSSQGGGSKDTWVLADERAEARGGR